MTACAPAAPVRRARQPLERPFETPPGMGELREVADGVLWLRMPLPYATDHINLWLLADEDAAGPGWALIDTGVKSQPSMDLWRGLIAPGGGLERAGRRGRLTRVICTHFHTDHAGMAGWLTRKLQCPLWMTRLEYLSGRMHLAEWGQPAPDGVIGFYAACGWSAESLDRLRARYGRYAAVVHRFPDAFHALLADQVLPVGAQRWQVFIGRGHSPEHASLVNDEAGIVIAGDQALPDISSNVSVTANEPGDDPLGDWIDSLQRMRRRCDRRMLVLPSHGLPYRGLHLRIDELRSGHEASLDNLLSVLKCAPRRAIDVFPTLFSRPVTAAGTLDRLLLATGESLAHLNHLERRGQAVRTTEVDGVNWWSA
jgi:glyoxylase-like metal-dependent hydrolase (beta-lactamase superfamily II)